MKKIFNHLAIVSSAVSLLFIGTNVIAKPNLASSNSLKLAAVSASPSVSPERISPATPVKEKTPSPSPGGITTSPVSTPIATPGTTTPRMRERMPARPDTTVSPNRTTIMHASPSRPATIVVHPTTVRRYKITTQKPTTIKIVPVKVIRHHRVTGGI